MFKFTDGKITSELCQPVVTSIVEDGEVVVDFGYSLIIDNEEFVFTESELQYMIDQVKDFKEGE
tara:strand:- start:3665 stop:3856 length:192 start_codon:yes stop_codon:yes gene_type:complete